MQSTCLLVKICNNWNISSGSSGRQLRMLLDRWYETGVIWQPISMKKWTVATKNWFYDQSVLPKTIREEDWPTYLFIIIDIVDLLILFRIFFNFVFNFFQFYFDFISILLWESMSWSIILQKVTFPWANWKFDQLTVVYLTKLKYYLD